MTEKSKPNTAEEEKVNVDRWNEETTKALRRLQVAVEQLADSKRQKLENNAARTFTELRIMIWVAFGFGLGLIVVSIALFVVSERTLSVLGLGTLGVADWVALFFYKPMDRLQTADKDYLQQIVVVKGWALSINLEMLAMKVNDPVSLLTASKNIRTVTAFVAHSLQEFVSTPQQVESSPQQTQTVPPGKKP
jgi:hypothetical protein